MDFNKILIFLFSKETGLFLQAQQPLGAFLPAIKPYDGDACMALALIILCSPISLACCIHILICTKSDQ